MIPEEYLYPAWFIFLAFGAAFHSKFLGTTIVWALALVAVYPDIQSLNFMSVFMIATLIIAGFRG